MRRAAGAAAIVLCLFALAIAWRSSSPQSLTSRARHLIKTGKVYTFDLPMLVEQFGPPDQDGYFREWDHAFILGPDEGSYFGIDSSWLIVRLGDDGKVREAQLATD